MLPHVDVAQRESTDRTAGDPDSVPGVTDVEPADGVARTEVDRIGIGAGDDRAGASDTGEGPAVRGQADPEHGLQVGAHRALTDFTQALLGSNEFLYFP